MLDIGGAYLPGYSEGFRSAVGFAPIQTASEKPKSKRNPYASSAIYDRMVDPLSKMPWCAVGCDEDLY